MNSITGGTVNFAIKRIKEGDKLLKHAVDILVDMGNHFSCSRVDLELILSKIH